MIGLTQAMAVDHGKDHIRVNCICPGPMYTPMVYARGNGMSEAARAQRAKASVLKIEGTGWDIGHAVRFLLSATTPATSPARCWWSTAASRCKARNAIHRITVGDEQDGPPALSRGRPGRARISRHAEAQHQPAQAAGQLARHGARLQRRRRLHPLQEQARPAPARAGDPAGRLAGEARSTSSPIT